ncbi:MAG: sensor histidine kinase [Planctomycetota bacterium]|jgi:signal transduction histidine kinase
MKDPLFWVPVKYKLPLTFVLICLVAFGVGGFVVTSTARDVLERQIHLRLDERAAASRTVVTHHLGLIARRAEDFASDGFIRTHLAAIVAGDAGATGRLREHLRANKLPLVAAFVDAAVLDHAGRVRVTVTGEVTGSTAATTSFTPLRAPTADRPYPAFSVQTPLSRIDGNERIGTLVLAVRADTWAAGMQELGALPEAGMRSIAIVGADGLRLALAGTVTPGDPIAYEEAIPETGWHLALAADRDEVMRPIAGLRARFIAIGIALLSVAACVIFFPVRFLLAPLGRIREAARRITEGDFTARVSYDSGDEIGDLSRAFDHMAGAVEERTTALQRREREHRRERDRLDALIRTMHDGLFLLEEDGTVSLANEAAGPVVAALGCGDGQPRGDCGGLAGGDCITCLKQANHVHRTCELEIGDRVYEVHVTRLPGPGPHAARLCVSRDITERIAQAEVQANQERMSVLGNISAVMAHELNNPLAAIAMFSQMLETELDAGSSARESAGVIRRNAETCKRTIRGLLDTASHSPPERAPFDILELADDVGRFLQPIYERSDVEYRVEASGDVPEAVGDELQLRQVLINLVMNAVHAMRSGGRVTVSVARRGAFDVVEVRDTGPGIPKRLRERIFDPFFTTKPPGVGTGLGLSTSQRIVAAHGGRLELSSTGPGGTVFRVTIPIAAETAEVSDVG